MKFVPMNLYKYLAPPERCEHLEERIQKLTATNSDYHKQIIELGNQIIQLSGELEETKQELEESKRAANTLNANVLHLTEGLNERERKRECLFAKLEAHRDAFRLVVATLTKLGARDPVNDGL